MPPKKQRSEVKARADPTLGIDTEERRKLFSSGLAFFTKSKEVWMIEKCDHYAKTGCMKWGANKAIKQEDVQNLLNLYGGDNPDP